MKITERNLQILLAKVRFNTDTRQIYGHFTFSEVVILVEHFGLMEREGGYTYRYSKENMAKGVNAQTWCYFNENTRFLKKHLRIPTRHHWLTNKLVYKKGNTKCL